MIGGVISVAGVWLDLDSGLNYVSVFTIMFMCVLVGAGQPLAAFWTV